MTKSLAERRKVVAGRYETPTSAGPDTRQAAARMPEEFLTEQVQRLAIFSYVAAAVWTFAAVITIVALPAALGTPRNWRSINIELVGAATSLTMCLYMRLSQASPQAKSNVGLAFMVANALGVAVLNAWALPPPNDEGHFSWATIVILVYAMIAPSNPKRLLVASLLAASMDPAAYLLAGAQGIPAPSPLYTFILCWPNYACAVIAMLPSRILERVGRRLREAQELGSYSLVELLGHGGMGEVWRAKHRLLARDAAIKLVRPEVLGARTELEIRTVQRRFEREAQATAALGSPHSIQIFDFGVTDDGTFYYVMELLAGRDLESLVREFGPLPAQRVIHLLRQVCHSLADAHARGLVHRDIKPANIYVCRMGLEYDFVKVLDFGLVKINQPGRRGDTLATIDHTTSGTPAYMAPETILGDDDIDRRADVYALGCVAYYLLTGQLVFEADSPMKMLLQHLHAEPIPPSQRSELPIPPELDELVLACLRKDPATRPQDAGDLFRMATHCHTCDGWNQDMARAWWELHLTEFTGALTVADARRATDDRVAAL